MLTHRASTQLFYQNHFSLTHDPIFECGLPVARLDGSNVSTIIKEAHSVASKTGLSDEELLSFYAGYRPNFLVHLQDEQRQNAQVFCDRIIGTFQNCAGVEWRDGQRLDYSMINAHRSSRFAPIQNSKLLI